MVGRGDLDEPRRLCAFNWWLVGCGALALGICLAVSRFSLEIEHSFVHVLVTAACFAAVGHYFSSHRWLARPAFALISMAQLDLLGFCGTPLTYIAASAALPLQDATLSYWDQCLGLDWTAYYNFCIARPMVLQYAYFFYAMIIWPGMGVPILLALTKNYVRLQQFTMACTLTIFATAIISALLPAIGTYQQYGVPAETPTFNAIGYLIQLDRLPLARDGTLRVLNLSQIGGIVTFPSFHAAVAMLAMWGLWCLWWMRPLALITMGGMLIATPLLGGHYFVDVIAGVLVAAVAITVVTRLGTPAASTQAARRPAAARGLGAVDATA
jgi:membrane-associated phospholipid phosphatase